MTASFRALLTCFLLTAAFCFDAAGQTDNATGNPITDDQLVNNTDQIAGPSRTYSDPTYSRRAPNNGRRTSGTRTEDRDANGRLTKLELKDARGTTRRTVDITYDDLGAAHMESTTYLANGKPERTDVTDWHAGDDGQRRTTHRETTIFDPTRVGPDGKPLVIDHWVEEMRDGRWVRVGQPTTARKSVSRGFYELSKTSKIQIRIVGTGETIGTVAKMKVTNNTDKPITAEVPPHVLISASGKSQHYAVPFPETVSIDPGKTETVPLDGVCISRSKPPVEDGAADELIAQDGEGNPLNSVPRGKTETPKFSAVDTAQILDTVGSCYKAAEKLQEDGSYEKMPYDKPEMQKNIAIQWAVWCNPQLAKITGEKTATKKDLTKTIYKQVEQGGVVTEEKKKKLDSGINEIFQSIELTGKKAKEIRG